MPEIRLVKKYPHIKDEDVISIFQEGYIKGFENGRKGAIPIEWLKNKSKDLADAYWNNVRNKLVLNMNELPLVIDEMIRIWEKENADNN